jgi:hypothetical protein
MARLQISLRLEGEDIKIAILNQDLTAFFQHCTFIYIQNDHANHLTIVSEEIVCHVLQNQHPENLFVT